MKKRSILQLISLVGILWFSESVLAYTYYPSMYGNTYIPSYTYIQDSSTYPGCGQADIIIGGQIWASCNVYSKSTGSNEKSGWFFAKDSKASFVSYNGLWAPLEWKWKVKSMSSWYRGPCANWYRIPSRWDWETALYYARLNKTSVSNLLNLPTNGGFRGQKDSDGDVLINGQLDVLGSYWTSSVEFGNYAKPIIMRINGVYQNYRLDGTYYSQKDSGYQWQYGENGLSLVTATSSDLANVRCIKN